MPSNDLSKLLARFRLLETESIRLSTTDPSRDEPEIKAYEVKLDLLEASHSGSWFGDHAFTYYNGFDAPPTGRSFNVEWGFISSFHRRSNDNWHVYTRDEIKRFVFADTNENILEKLTELSDRLEEQFSTLQNQTLDTVETLASNFKSDAIARYVTSVKSLESYKIVDYLNGRLKSAPRMTRDSAEIAKGQIVPAHVQFRAPLQALDVNRRRCKELATTIRNIIELIDLQMPKSNQNTSSTDRIFIGHGRSEQWRVLKDFLVERLHLDFDEFNRVSAAGINTQERLAEMLDRCNFAFLIFTAEDVRGDGNFHARENVIHEAGLFQGRMGWRRAIILLEDGCAEFSNVVGLGQIRFSKDNIAGCFEEVRRVLEREKIVSP